MIASYTTHIQIYPPDPFYLFFSLPIYYWIGILILIVAILIRIIVDIEITKTDTFIDIAILGLTTFYYSITTFVYPTIRYVDTYYLYWYLLNPVISAGTINIPVNYSPMYYTIFNASTIFFAYIFQFNLSPSIVANSFPILVISTGSIITYILCMKYSGRYALIGGLFFILFNWDACHLAPQHYSYILSFLILFLIVILLIKKKKEKIIYFIPLLILLVVITLSHLLASIILLYFFVSIFIIFIICELLFGRLKYLLNPIKDYCNQKKIILLPTFFLFIAFITYMIFIGIYYFQKLATFSNVVFSSFFEYHQINLVHRAVLHTIPSSLYMDVYYIRISVLFSYLILSVIFSLIIIYIYLKQPSAIKKISYVIFMIIALFVLFSFGGILLATGNATYGYERSYPLSLIFFGVLASVIFSLNNSLNKVISVLKKIIVIFIVILIILLPIIKYGSDPYHFFSESEDKANQFGINHIEKFEMTLYENNTFSIMTYNDKALEDQAGLQQYLNKFNNKSLNKIYDVGKTCKIYLDFTQSI